MERTGVRFTPESSGRDRPICPDRRIHPATRRAERPGCCFQDAHNGFPGYTTFDGPFSRTDDETATSPMPFQSAASATPKWKEERFRAPRRAAVLHFCDPTMASACTGRPRDATSKGTRAVCEDGFNTSCPCLRIDFSAWTAAQRCVGPSLRRRRPDRRAANSPFRRRSRHCRAVGSGSAGWSSCRCAMAPRDAVAAAHVTTHAACFVTLSRQ